ncbi:CsiV family protein [Thalassotalea nanhaiensis]|uniref:CsiV family protein n=1 Tax=Thalassotalea nanhaiensis TaxID=3065648 RepID=A0ABY9TEN3_9GAMM|nr:CsiV family protein [Colwelliaceae bacterium SQ345]
MQVNNAMTTLTSMCNKQIKPALAKLAHVGFMFLCLFVANASAQDELPEEEPAERWFEIEVILLEQLIDKSRYNEDFNQQVALNNGKAVNNVSLLNGYLQNIVNFKQQLDTCPPVNTRNEINSADNIDKVKGSTKSKVSLAEVEQELENLSLACKQNEVNIFENAIDKEFYQIPRVISANEDLYANVPYLLNKDSLELTHIRQSLSRSKHFKPLLHVAWRQAVVDRRAAKPVRLMAGENQSLTKVTNDDVIELDKDLQITEEEKQEIITNHLGQIIEDIEQNNIQLDVLTKQIKNQQIQPLFDEQTTAATENIDKQHKQNWHIDGLFNVHLDHYLYINSQFNVITETTSNNNDKPSDNLVPFKQNRRVISGEVHYFDHPYMGMIVQIRRHEKPEVIDEETPNETQDNEEIDANSDYF